MNTTNGLTNENSPLDDSRKLAIREEVERRFEHPPDAFTRLIQEEVERRVNDRVKQYKTLGMVTFVLFTTAFALLYNKTLAAARTEVVHQLAEQEVIKARDRVFKIASTVEEQGGRVGGMLNSTQEKYDGFLERLNQIKREDNVVLLEKDGTLRLHGNLVLDNGRDDAIKVVFQRGGGVLSLVNNTITEVRFPAIGGIKEICNGQESRSCN